MEEGITKGEIPYDGECDYKDIPSAANLTTDGNPANQAVWLCDEAHKMQVRLTVEIPESELTTFKQMRERFKHVIRERLLKYMAPYEERKKWFYAFDGVRPEQIVSVEYWDYQKNGYQPVKDLPKFLEACTKETEEFLDVFQVQSGMLNGAMGIKLKHDKWQDDSWFFSESIPRDW